MAAALSGVRRGGAGYPNRAWCAAGDHSGDGGVVAENGVAVDAGGPRLRHGAVDPQDSGGVAGATLRGAGGGIDGGFAPAGAGLESPATGLSDARAEPGASGCVSGGEISENSTLGRAHGRGYRL